MNDQIESSFAEVKTVDFDANKLEIAIQACRMKRHPVLCDYTPIPIPGGASLNSVNIVNKCVELMMNGHIIYLEGEIEIILYDSIANSSSLVAIKQEMSSSNDCMSRSIQDVEFIIGIVHSCSAIPIQIYKNERNLLEKMREYLHKK